MLKQTCPFVGEVYCVQPSILRALAAFDQTTVFQHVEQLDEAAGMRPEHCRELLLADTGRAVQDPDDSRIGRRKVERREQGRVEFGRVRTDLREEEGGIGCQRWGAGR